MNLKHTNLVLISSLLFSLSACSPRTSLVNDFSKTSSNSVTTKSLTSSVKELFSFDKTNDSEYLASGRIVLSFPLDGSPLAGIENEIDSNGLSINNPENNHKEVTMKPGGPTQYAPIVGYFPLLANFQPADNEVWIELDRDKKQLAVYKGTEQIKAVVGEGVIALAPGEYPLQHKQKGPLWYATDQYFEKRRLRVPPRGDNFRYRRGALGSYALYPTTEFIIHSGPFWSEEIGGLRIAEADLASIFLMINVGAPVVIK